MIDCETNVFGRTNVCGRGFVFLLDMDIYKYYYYYVSMYIYMYVLLFMTFFEEYCISVGTDSHSSSRPSMKPLQFYWILCCLFSLLSLVAGYNGNFFQRIARDFKALSSRSTTRWLTTCMHKNSIPLRHLAHRLRS